MIDAIGVAIPARDEAESIATCLASIAAAAERIAVPVTVVLAADTCLDDTVARAWATALATGLDLEVVPCQVGAAGLARRAAGRRVLERLDEGGVPVERTWIASADADTHVPADWFVRQLAWEACGLDGVAGLVDIGPDASPQMRALFEMATISEGRGPGHRHVHGANLAVRGSTLRAVGGFPSVALGEDHELWMRLAAIPARIHGVVDMTVVTSRRLTSHTVGGFATYLSDLTARPEPPKQVEGTPRPVLGGAPNAPRLLPGDALRTPGARARQRSPAGTSSDVVRADAGHRAAPGLNRQLQ